MNAPLPPDAIAVAMLPVAQIAESPTNPRKRFDDDYIAELAESIKVHGLIQPITVRPHPTPGSPWPYELVVGACRLRAAELAGLEHIPGFWRELDNKQVLEIQVIENLQRRDVHPIEEADGYDQLIKLHGYNADELGDKIGKSRSYVYGRLKLLALGKDARKSFEEGKLEASVALLIARVPPSLQKKALDLVIDGYGGQPLSFRSAKDTLQRQFTISLKQATFPLDDAKLVPLAGACTNCPKRAGNDLIMTAEGVDADVCTDTKCFDDKRAERHLQLIENAKKRKIPVFTGEAAREIAPHGRWSIDEERYIVLDDEVYEDEQGRTYRQILGDKAPVAAIVEVGNDERTRELVELAEPTAIEKALKKAGWTPSEETTPGVKMTPRPGETPEQRAKREQEATERAERERRADEENEWREKLVPEVLARIEQPDLGFDLERTIKLLAVAHLRQDAAYGGLNEDILERHGITVPDEYDDREELSRIAALMLDWPVGKALAYLFDSLTLDERTVSSFDFEPEQDRPHTLLALATLVGLDPSPLPNRASTPSEAAQANEVGATEPAAPAKTKGKKAAAKKAEEKADPAPATPANEPAAPVKTSALKPADAWPFPTGNRP